MNVPASTREALIAEALGDVARLLREVEAVAPKVTEACAAFERAETRLHHQLAGFDDRMAAITERAKQQTVKHLAARTDEAARKSIDQQSRAMADAARVAFGAEVGAMVQRLQVALQPLVERRQRRLESWLTHAAAAAVAAAATWALMLYLAPR